MNHTMFLKASGLESLSEAALKRELGYALKQDKRSGKTFRCSL
jgi:hypothetical protein